MLAVPIIAVDIGNARMKLGLFSHPQKDCGEALPKPEAVMTVDGSLPAWARLRPWLKELGQGQLHWLLASVNRPAATRLLDWLRAERPADAATLLAAGDLPLEVCLPRPDMVGIDRLVDALAVNRLRTPGRSAVVVDVGSAITVDLVSADGAFLGGAILPGIAMSARALHEFTDLLPMLDMVELGTPPPALGDSTLPAIRSGLFWGAVGGIRQVIERLGKEHGGRPEVFLTGGAAASVADLLGRTARHVPQLTLAGIALAAKGHTS